MADGQWAPHALVRRNELDGERHRTVAPAEDVTFSTADEAEAVALRLAKAWVDQNG